MVTDVVPNSSPTHSEPDSVSNTSESTMIHPIEPMPNATGSSKNHSGSFSQHSTHHVTKHVHGVVRTDRAGAEGGREGRGAVVRVWRDRTFGDG